MLNYLQSVFWSVLGADTRGEVTVGRWTVSALLAWASATWGPYLSAYAADPFVFLVSVLWMLDFILGFWLAARERRLSPRRGLYSLVKWLTYMAVLAVGWAFRVNGIPVDDWIALMLGSAICLTEGISVIRNAGRLSGIPRLLALADYLDSEADHQVDLLRANLRGRRRRAGLPYVCPGCGDRRPAGGACPKCGAEPEAPAPGRDVPTGGAA